MSDAVLLMAQTNGQSVSDDLYQHSLCGFLSTGPDGKLMQVNQTFLEWTGYRQEEVIGKRRFDQFLSPAAVIFHQTYTWPVLILDGCIREVAVQIVRKDGSRLPALINIKQHKSDNAAILATHFTIFNASERWRYEEELVKARKAAEASEMQMRELNCRLLDSNAALHEQTERLHVTLNTIQDGVIATDTEGRVAYINPAASRLCGCDGAQVAGQPISAVFHPVDAETGMAFHMPSGWTGAADGMPQSGSWQLHRNDADIPVTISVAPMRHENGNVLGSLIVFRDMSAAREYETRLHHQATHDALTGLINRSEFERRLSQALHAEAPPGHTLMYLDLDQFKIVNDTCGHVAGDELMRQFAHIMQRALRREDTLARLGGDEFGVLLRRSSHGEALAVAERLRQTAREFSFVWTDKMFPIGLSIGLIHLAPGEMNHDDAMRIADSACYVAKDKGRNRIHVSMLDDSEVERHKGEAGWVSRLHAALREDRFVLFAQEIRPLHPQPGHAGHFEILIRLRDADGTLISPMAFIPAAERYGIMPEIDRWVIGTLLSQFHALHPQGFAAPMYSVNLSGMTLCDDAFLPFVREAFARHHVDASRICFEVTETAAIANLSQATLLIDALKAMGCRFSLDDFGSGMSSFGYLKHLPVDYLKIDGKFVKGLLKDRVNYAMVEAINRVGQVIGLKTIAEFVENDDMLAALHAIGIDFAQGYGVQRPQQLYPV